MKGHVYQRSKGSWTIVYDLPPDGSRKRKQKFETFKGITKRQAEQKLRDRLTALDNGSYIPLAKETVARFLEKWLEVYAATNTTLRTQQGYRDNITRYIIPATGRVELQKLTPAQIQEMYADLLERPLKNRTVLHVHRVLSEALKHAVRWGLLARNPADATTPPRAEQDELEMWDAPTVDLFLKAIIGHRFEDFYHLALLTGMRRSELCGLKWEDVDLVAGRLSVVRTLQHIKGKGLVEGQPKTRRSRRSIALSPQAVDVLHSIRGRQIEQQLEAAPLWQNIGNVFTQADGKPMNPNKITQEFTAIVRGAGLSH